MLLSCETVRISSPAFYKDPPLHESQFRSPADVEINSLASFDAARVKDLFVLLPWLLPLRLGCSARRLGSAARHSSKAAWRLGSPARHGGALRQLATPRGDSARRGLNSPHASCNNAPDLDSGAGHVHVIDECRSQFRTASRCFIASL